METDAPGRMSSMQMHGPARPAAGSAEATLLVGDIGGTNARLALVSPEGGPGRPLRHAVMPSARYGGAEELIAEFLGDGPERVAGVVLAVAGPVVEGRAALSNLGWTVDALALRDALDVADVRLINDLVALATAIPHLEPAGLRTIQDGIREPGGAIAVVAPGTGLGMAFLTRNGARYHPHPSEGGHADFAPADALQLELLDWMRHRDEHVSSEDVCSGRALPALYDFLAQRGEFVARPLAPDGSAAATDRTPAIVRAAFDPDEPCPLSRAAVDLFAAILAAEAGNAALRVLATGGVYLAGGMARHILAALDTADVRERFRRKGRLTPLLERIPLHVVTQRRVALLGAAHYALSAELDGVGRSGE